MTDISLEDDVAEGLMTLCALLRKTPSEVVKHILCAFGVANWLGVVSPPRKGRQK